ncbi:MAG: Crp/Fnr family transcriptional regulator [Calditrichaeota bacterium]|nr:MAG: Crp/Fnr family transcriptional regulator [Calditrichota bacterium]
MNNPVQLPFLERASRKFLDEWHEYAVSIPLKAPKFLNLEGDTCNYFHMVEQGSVRVYICNDLGKEITLYKLAEGESCLLTAFSILSQTPFPAYSRLESGGRLISVPAPIFRDWINRYEEWRHFLFSLLSGRVQEILGKLESLAFLRVDERVAEYLLRCVQQNKKQVRITHSQLAQELGTAREVVSRILKSFERSRLIALSRGHITILNSRGLSRFAPAARN